VDWIDSLLLICLNFVLGMISASLGCRKNPKCYAFHIDANKLATARRDGISTGTNEGEKVDYVSG
jgi:hypothetical protein